MASAPAQLFVPPVIPWRAPQGPAVRSEQPLGENFERHEIVEALVVGG